MSTYWISMTNSTWHAFFLTPIWAFTFHVWINTDLAWITMLAQFFTMISVIVS